MSKITTTPYPTSTRSLLLVLERVQSLSFASTCARGCSIRGVYYPGCRRSSSLTNETKINRFTPQPRPTRGVLTSAVISGEGRDCYEPPCVLQLLQRRAGNRIWSVRPNGVIESRLFLAWKWYVDMWWCVEFLLRKRSFFCHALGDKERGSETFNAKFEVLEVLSCLVGQWEIPKMWFIASMRVQWIEQWNGLTRGGKK